MKKGITFGAFDLFHAGHVLMLQEAKTVCDYLIVCIQTDPSFDRKSKNTPVQSLLEETNVAWSGNFVIWSWWEWMSFISWLRSFNQGKLSWNV